MKKWRSSHFTDTPLMAVQKIHPPEGQKTTEEDAFNPRTILSLPLSLLVRNSITFPWIERYARKGVVTESGLTSTTTNTADTPWYSDKQSPRENGQKKKERICISASAPCNDEENHRLPLNGRIFARKQSCTRTRDVSARPSATTTAPVDASSLLLTPRCLAFSLA